MNPELLAYYEKEYAQEPDEKSKFKKSKMKNPAVPKLSTDYLKMQGKSIPKGSYIQGRQRWD